KLEPAELLAVALNPLVVAVHQLRAVFLIVAVFASPWHEHPDTVLSADWDDLSHHWRTITVDEQRDGLSFSTLGEALSQPLQEAGVNGDCDYVLLDWTQDGGHIRVGQVCLMLDPVAALPMPVEGCQ